MARSTSIAMLARQINQLRVSRSSTLSLHYSTFMQSPSPRKSNTNVVESDQGRFDNRTMSQFMQSPPPRKSNRNVVESDQGRFDNRTMSQFMQSPPPRKSNRNVVESDQGQFDNRTMSQLSPGNDTRATAKPEIGEHVPRREKIKVLVNTLLELDDSKERVYGTLDAWVAWEQSFPIGALKNVLIALEKEQQWHRVIQVIKWMLSKGQGNTMGTYGQLIRALDMDHRATEAHQVWVKKIGSDLHSVPWKLCDSMISIYYRNNMLENLVKLFKGLEAFDRKPPEKSIVQKVANAYETMGLLEEKERVLEKYNDLLNEIRKRHPGKFYRPHSNKETKSKQKK